MKRKKMNNRQRKIYTMRMKRKGYIRIKNFYEKWRAGTYLVNTTSPVHYMEGDDVYLYLGVQWKQ